jgi:hypothetical protein
MPLNDQSDGVPEAERGDYDSAYLDGPSALFSEQQQGQVQNPEGERTGIHGQERW